MEKVRKIFYQSIIIITTIILGWVLLLFLNQGIGLAPTILLFSIFILVVISGFLLHRQKYQDIFGWCKKHFPTITRDKILKVGLAVALIIGLLARLSFLLIGDRYCSTEDTLSDNGVHWFYASKLVNGETIEPLEGLNEAVFPHLNTYSVTLAAFMNIFGTNYNAVLFSNLLFDLVATILIYVLLKMWKNQNVARIGAVLWWLNPLEILFCGCSLAIVVTNMWVVIALLLGYLMLNSLRLHKWLQIIFSAIGLGIAISIGNAYRPIFTVILIAFVLTAIFQILHRDKTPLKYSILSLIGSFVLIWLAQSGCSSVITVIQRSNNPYAVSSSVGVGWSAFVGANYETHGHWSAEDSAIFGQLLYGQPADETDVVAVQKQFLDLAIDRYKAMGIAKIPLHLLNKSVTLFANNSETITWPVVTGFDLSYENPIYLSAHSLGVLFVVLCLVLSLWFCLGQFWQGKWQLDTYTLFLALSFCGLMAASLLVEVMRRYIMPLLVILVLLSAAQLVRLIGSKESKHA